MDSNNTSLLCSNEVTKTQESLVRIRLRLKTLTDSFYQVKTQDEMETVNGEIRSELDTMRSLIGTLKRLSCLQRDSKARTMLLKDVESHEQQLFSCQTEFKRANLRCIQELDRRRHDDLFQTETKDDDDDDDVGSLRSRRHHTKPGFVTESTQATAKLSSLSRQLAATVERSSLTLSDLEQSSQILTETNEEFKGMASVIGQSKKLLTKYGRREHTDRVLIVFAFAFFFACVFYILRKRVFPVESLVPSIPSFSIWRL